MSLVAECSFFTKWHNDKCEDVGESVFLGISSYHRCTGLVCLDIFNRPGVAGAVLLTALSLIN